LRFSAATARRRERATGRFAVAIKAFHLHEQGVKAVRVADIRSALKAKNIDSNFPGTGTAQAAE
jgi:hypothetical protein